MTIRITVFRNVTPCSLMDKYQCFWVTFSYVESRGSRFFGNVRTYLLIKRIFLLTTVCPIRIACDVLTVHCTWAYQRCSKDGIRRYLYVGHQDLQGKLLKELPCSPMELAVLQFETGPWQEIYESLRQRQAVPSRTERLIAVRIDL
jgi:hypothetical protein